MDKYTEILKESVSKSLGMKQKYLFGNIMVFVKDPLPKKFNLNFVIKKIEDTIPYDLVYELDAVYIGQFDFLDRKNYTATYMDNALYITNKQGNEKGMVQDFVHEIAHMIEQNNSSQIYSDRKLENEFLKKRRQLESVLSTNGHKPPPLVMRQTEYNPHLDQFFVKTIGYPLLTTLINGIFDTPYSVTSVHEYFARGFEEFMMGKKYQLKKSSPILYDKIEELVYVEGY
jgi:ribosome-binding ATPase YchF (GTP1/OBG family)